MGRKLVLTGTKLTNSTAPVLVSAFATDDFNRAGPAAGSTPVGNKPWTALTAEPWTIVNNRFQAPSTLADPNAGARMVVDTGSAVHYAQFRALTTTGVYVVAGMTDTGVGYMAGRSAGEIKVWQLTATSLGTIIANWPVPDSSDWTIGLYKNGSTLSVYYNGALLGSVTNTAASGTRAGVLSIQGTGRVVDDFKALDRVPS